jgi:T5SS/PEP-CTERM-associated repeat protein
VLVGGGGAATLSIINGARAISEFGVVSGIANSATITGDGSNWQVSESLTANGTIRLTAGGDVFSQNGYIGSATGLSGVVTVDGVGSNWSSAANLYVGTSGAGTLEVTAGGVVQAFNVFVGTAGQLRGDSNVIANVQNGGLLSPGISPGTLILTGNFSQTASGDMLVELASTASFDRLLVSSTATLNGTLTIQLLDGFIPNVGQSFTFLAADDVDGTFATEMLPSVPNLAFDVIYNSQSVVLTVFSALPGDYNANGTVDVADYTVWRDSVGGSSLLNEGASPGTVDDLDYDFWKMHFGESGSGSAGASPSQTAVPEPTSLILACCAVLFAAAVAASRAARDSGSIRTCHPTSGNG